MDMKCNVLLLKNNVMHQNYLKIITIYKRFKKKAFCLTKMPSNIQTESISLLR